MAAVNGVYAGDITEIYFLASPLSTVDEASIETAAVDANEVPNVTEIGTLASESDIITYNVAGATFSGSLPGQRNPGTFDFGIAIDWTQAIVTTIYNDTGKSTRGIILVYNESSTNKTYIYFEGRVASTSISGNVGEVATINCSIARTGAATVIQNA